MKKIAIIGAGISGLFAANLFSKNSDYQVMIYEKNNSIELDEGYGIQLSTNSIKLLNNIGFNNLEDIDQFNPEQIDFYDLKNQKKICELNISKFNTENCKYTALKRSKLVEFLKDRLDNQVIKYGHNIQKIEKKDDQIVLSFNENNLQGDIPFVEVRKHPWRSLKTSASARVIPLSGNGPLGCTENTATSGCISLCLP